MDAVSRARFEPAQVAGLPVAVNMVWLVARTTVRANNKHHISFNLPAASVPPLPLAKKHIVSARTRLIAVV